MKRKIENENLRSLTDRINYAIKIKNFTKSELAKTLGISRQSLQYLCSNQQNSSKFTFEISSALNINPIWLGTGEGDIDLVHETKIPILKDNQISLFLSKNIPSSDLIKTINITSTIVGTGFAIELQDQSMSPRFDVSSTLIFDTEKKYVFGDYVLAYVQTLKSHIFREYTKEDGDIILKPFNIGLSKKIKLSENDKVIGVLVEARWKNL